MMAISEGPYVESVDVAAYRIPTETPESDGTLEWSATTLLLVRVTAGVSVGTGYSYADASCVPLIRDRLTPLVLGRSAWCPSVVTWALVDECRNLGVSGLVAAAISAIDVALHDLAARLAGVPLARLLGQVRDDIPIYGSGGFTSYSDQTLAAQLAGWADAGIPRVKMKIGRDPDRDPHRLRVARRTIGESVELFVDANGAYAPRSAVDWVRLCREEFDVRWFEEPVSSDDVKGLAFVRASAPGGIAIAAGEYGWTPWYYQAFLAAEALDCVQADVTRCLGITGFLAVAGACEVWQVDLSAHCAPHISAHAAAAVRRLRPIEYFHDHVRIESMAFDGVLEPIDGALRPALDAPGHGLVFKESDVEGFRVA